MKELYSLRSLDEDGLKPLIMHCHIPLSKKLYMEEKSNALEAATYY
jgi:hypothetical protein